VYNRHAAKLTGVNLLQMMLHHGPHHPHPVRVVQLQQLRLTMQREGLVLNEQRPNGKPVFNVKLKW